ncbi:hypothetical protein TNIN_260991 [Trichonephila inaurata madagascariensis]|uniref:Uncharacterized protein n=1 Tax=Trichonephila inaurata madagascariensis TaxID=2747483 RepID=A0A8X7C9C7_9ARAC|nr:hypothetical protein TNIN_260991 [Trichonephila inaurata madagascariensis]
MDFSIFIIESSNLHHWISWRKEFQIISNDEYHWNVACGSSFHFRLYFCFAKCIALDGKRNRHYLGEQTMIKNRRTSTGGVPTSFTCPGTASARKTMENGIAVPKLLFLSQV